MSWSGGKDSCLALYQIQKSPKYRVADLYEIVAFERYGPWNLD